MTPTAFAAFLPTVSLRLPRALCTSSRATSRCPAHRTTTMAAPDGPDNSLLFAVRATDGPSLSDVRQQTRAAHLEWATSPGVDVLLGGPLRSSSDTASAPVLGSLLIVRAGSRSAVDTALQADPYAAAGLFADSEVRQWVCGMRSDAPLPRSLYMVWCVDRPDALALRKETRPRHLDWWRSAGRAGMIGPFPCDGGACGSLIVCEGGSIEEVRAWADTDPYKLADLFESVHISAVAKVIEDGKLIPSQ